MNDLKPALQVKKNSEDITVDTTKFTANAKEIYQVDDVTQIRLTGSAATSLPTWTQIATLPAGYRPKNTITLWAAKVVGSDTVAHPFVVYASGEISNQGASIPSGTNISLAGVFLKG